jgi:TatD DNase family protein
VTQTALKMNLLDTHSHIYLPEFEPDRRSVLEKAAKEGVARILMPAIDASTHSPMLDLEKANPASCFCMMGLHPCSVKENYLQELAIAENHFEKRTFRAVG